MSTLSKMAAALPFAHLLGMAPRAAKADDDSDDDSAQHADESDEDYAKRMEDEDDEDFDKKGAKAADDEDGDGDDDNKESKSKAKSKAAADEGDDDVDKEDDTDKKGKKAKKAEEPEDDKQKAARASERARCAAIFKCDAAGVRPDVAAHLAFETDMSASAAVSMLKTVAAGGTAKPAGLASRMSSVKAYNVGADSAAAPAAGSSGDAAARIIAAGKARRGEK